MRAVTWAVVFYIVHAWPLAALAGIPTLVRMTAAVRGPSSSTTKLSGFLELFSPIIRVALLVVAATIDLAPDQAWWSNLWPGVWIATLGERFSLMSGRLDAWIWLGVGVLVAVLVLVGLTKLLTIPRAWAALLRALGRKPVKAARWAEALGLGMNGFVTLPLTSLTVYAAVARASYCLRP